MWTPPIPCSVASRVSCMGGGRVVIRDVNMTLHESGAMLLTRSNALGKSTFLRLCRIPNATSSRGIQRCCEGSVERVRECEKTTTTGKIAGNSEATLASRRDFCGFGQPGRGASRADDLQPPESWRNGLGCNPCPDPPRRLYASYVPPKSARNGATIRGTGDYQTHDIMILGQVIPGVIQNFAKPKAFS